jgi:hypothetical protein
LGLVVDAVVVGVVGVVEGVAVGEAVTRVEESADTAGRSIAASLVSFSEAVPLCAVNTKVRMQIPRKEKVVLLMLVPVSRVRPGGSICSSTRVPGPHE